MQIGQFIHGMIDGSVEHRQSANLESLFRDEDLRFLIGLTEVGDYKYIWRLPIAVSRSMVVETRDNDGRKGTVNHTIIAVFEPADLVKYLPEELFFRNVDSNPLPPLTLEG